MLCRSRLLQTAIAGLVLALLAPWTADAGRRRGGGGTPHEAVGSLTFASPQAQPIALSPTQDRLYVANTAAGKVQVIDTNTNVVIDRIEVGIDPVSVAVRPDGLEVWAANHVSDSVSVIDTNPASASLHQVVETIQDADADLVTLFDEPVGVAFASNSKAYVSLSSRDQIAVVDATTYTVSGVIDVNAQDPRAMRVRGGLLYVLPFESGNQTELSACPDPPFPADGDQCTFDIADIPNGFAQNPNMTGVTVDVVRDPDVPDRDLYVYDTTDESLVDVVDGLGTLLYGLAVDSGGDVFVSLTEARNDANGRAGTLGQTLVDLDNRIFLNRIGTVSCGGGGCGAPGVIELEPLPPSQPAAGDQLATPYGIEVSDDDSTLVVTAAAASRLFTLDTGTGNVLDILDVGAIPRGVALRSDAVTGAPETAYVLNTLGNSVSVVDVSNVSNLTQTASIPLPGDPTPNDVRLGRIAFNNANASTTGTFACASCHPDGNTDQLLWVIGAQCVFSGCDQEEPRSTMPVRGLRDTLPLHWDGVLGDPFGGTNGEQMTGIFGSDTVPANCSDEQGCFRHLVDASQAGVMCDQTACPTNINELGLPGGLSEAARDNMATFLQNVSYPPARSRRPDDAITASALGGFEDFFFNQGGINPPGGSGFGPETCADFGGGCHALPFGTGTNSPFVGGFDAPTMRGITDRFVQFSAGVTQIEEILVLTTTADIIDPPFWTPDVGFDEFTVWKVAFGSATNPGTFRDVYDVAPFDIFQMIEEMSTGFPGAQGRQVTLNTRTATAPELTDSEAILDALEAADAAGLVNLRGTGLRFGSPITLTLRGDGLYHDQGSLALTRQDLLSSAASGNLLLTLTAELRANVGAPGSPQPALSVAPVGDFLSDGRPDLPVLPGDNPVSLRGLHVHQNAEILVDGQKVSGSISCLTGGFVPTCPFNLVAPTAENIEIALDQVPAVGTHLLQIQSPMGLLSNEVPFTVQ